MRIAVLVNDLGLASSEGNRIGIAGLRICRNSKPQSGQSSTICCYQVSAIPCVPNVGQGCCVPGGSALVCVTVQTPLELQSRVRTQLENHTGSTGISALDGDRNINIRTSFALNICNGVSNIGGSCLHGLNRCRQCADNKACAHCE